jgi:hypothetical protein
VLDPAVGPEMSIGRVVADVVVRRHRRVDPRRQVDDVADPVEELGVQGEPARVLQLEQAVQDIGQGARHPRMTLSESPVLISTTGTGSPSLMNGTVFSCSAWRMSLTPMNPRMAASP